MGTSGQPVEVTANFIRLNFKENSVFEYEVKFEPDQDYRHLRNKLLYGKNYAMLAHYRKLVCKVTCLSVL